MSRPPGIFKKDANARTAWGEAYDAIPKSVFALVAWNLANLVTDGSAEDRFIEELEILRYGGHLDKAQADAAVKALRRFI